MQAALNLSRPLARLTQSTTVSSSCFVHCSPQTARLGEGNRVNVCHWPAEQACDMRRGAMEALAGNPLLRFDETWAAGHPWAGLAT